MCRNKTSKSDDKHQEKIGVVTIEGLQKDTYFVKKTSSPTPRPIHPSKAETLSFLYVLLVWGVKLVSS
jgi:hypothetical protein